jgi:hypothetical protein
MKIRETLSFWCFAIGMMSWTAVLAITPVGGWCKSNPHSEDYQTAFAVTGIILLASMVNLLFNSKCVQDEK